MKMETSKIVTKACSLVLVFLSLIVFILGDTEEISVVLRNDICGTSLVESEKFKNCYCLFELSSRKYDFGGGARL